MTVKSLGSFSATDALQKLNTFEFVLSRLLCLVFLLIRLEPHKKQTVTDCEMVLLGFLYTRHEMRGLKVKVTRVMKRYITACFVGYCYEGIYSIVGI